MKVAGALFKLDRLPVRVAGGMISSIKATVTQTAAAETRSRFECQGLRPGQELGGQAGRPRQGIHGN